MHVRFRQSHALLARSRFNACDELGGDCTHLYACSVAIAPGAHTSSYAELAVLSFCWGRRWATGNSESVRPQSCVHLSWGNPSSVWHPRGARLHVWLIATKRTHLLLGYIVLGFRHPPLARADSAADSAAIT